MGANPFRDNASERFGDRPLPPSARRLPTRRLLPLRFALAYAALGAVWILLTDALVFALAKNDPATITRLQNIKGWFFVLISALALFLFLRHNLNRLYESVRSLERSESRYQRILDTAHEGIWMLDAAQTTTYVNRHMAEMLGYTVAEMVGCSRLDFVDEALRPALQAHFERQAQGVVENFEFRFRRKDGSPLWAIVSSTPVFDEQGRFTGALSMVTDISRHIELETRLEHMGRIVEFASDAIITTDMNQVITSWNRAAEVLYGWKAEEAIGQSLRLLQTEYISLEAVQRAMGKDGLWKGEVIQRRKDGTPLNILVSSAWLRDVEGMPVGVVTIHRDITERKQMEETLRLSNERLSTLREIDRGILAATALDEIVQAALSRIRKLIPLCRRAAVTLYQWESGTMQIIALDVNGEARYGKGSVVPIPTAGWMNELREGQVVRLDDLTTLSDPPETIRQLVREGMHSLVAIPIRDNGQHIGTLNLSASVLAAFTATDIQVAQEVADQLAVAIQHVRLRQRLEAANRELQEALKAKDEMLANVSHELRTPLTHIIGYSDLLVDGTLGEMAPDQRRAIQIIQTQAEALTRLVNTLLDLQMLSPDQFEWTQVDLREIVEGTLPRWRERAQKANVTIEMEMPPDVPRVRGDYDKLSQVLNHLLENAVKFMPDGGTVTVQLAQEGNTVRLSVRDTGIGIAPENLEKIFNRFYQVDGSSTRRFGGVGIGLALADKIVAAHGGRIWAESNGIPGHGTAIHITLPLGVTAAM